MPLPTGLLKKLCAEVGVTCETNEAETWQPFMCRQDHLRALVEKAYQAGREDLANETAEDFTRAAA